MEKARIAYEDFARAGIRVGPLGRKGRMRRSPAMRRMICPTASSLCDQPLAARNLADSGLQVLVLCARNRAGDVNEIDRAKSYSCAAAAHRAAN